MIKCTIFFKKFWWTEHLGYKIQSHFGVNCGPKLPSSKLSSISGYWKFLDDSLKWGYLVFTRYDTTRLGLLWIVTLGKKLTCSEKVVFSIKSVQYVKHQSFLQQWSELRVQIPIVVRLGVPPFYLEKASSSNITSIFCAKVIIIK